ncbi:MAG: hypothetical protein KKH88_00575 [Nanoarchaeota archaeon]|nr:hypothetical protein [Nanoarchaeota archaeon]
MPKKIISKKERKKKMYERLLDDFVYIFFIVISTNIAVGLFNINNFAKDIRNFDMVGFFFINAIVIFVVMYIILWAFQGFLLNKGWPPQNRFPNIFIS